MKPFRAAIASVLGVGASVAAWSALAPKQSDEILKNADLSNIDYHLPINSPEEALLAIRRHPPANMREMPGLLMPGSEQLVIQIDMVHGTPKPSDLKIPFHNHMGHVAQVAQHLAIILGTKEIYHDGITAMDIARIEQEFMKLAKANPAREDEERVSFYFRAAPIFEAHLAYGTIRILPTESSEILENRQRFGNSTTREDVYDEMRESHILETISLNPTPVAIIPMGAAHDLLPNIQRWNEQHPDHKFSYLRLRPNELPGDDEMIDWIRKNSEH